MTMSKTKKVHQVFALLNQNAPDGYASLSQLLEDASSIVNLFEEPTNEPNFELYVGGQQFNQWATDVAMNSQPWRLVCQERSVVEAFDMEDECYAESFQRAKYLMEYAA